MLWTTTSRASLLLRLPAAVLCVLSMAHYAAGQQDPATPPRTAVGTAGTGKLPADIEQVLWWLPEQTESFLVSRGSLPIFEEPQVEVQTSTWKKIPTGEQEEDPDEPIAESAVEDEDSSDGLSDKYEDLIPLHCITPFGWCGTLIFQDDSSHKIVNSFYGHGSAELFAKAAWWEKDVSRQTCEFVLFRDNTAARIVNTLAKYPSKRRNIAGVCVIEMDMHHGYHNKSMPGIPLDFNMLGPLKPKLRYLAAPRPNVYVTATSHELMKVILQRMKQRSAKRALPADLPGGRYIDPSAPAWGLRHYRPETAKKDPLSMLKWDPNAKGLIFFGGNKPSPFLGLRYVSDSADAGNRFLRMPAHWYHLKDSSRMAPMQRISANCVENRTRIHVPREDLDEMLLKTISEEQTFMCMYIEYLPWLGFSYPKIPFKSE